jgi:hypothetical protein
LHAGSKSLEQSQSELPVQLDGGLVQTPAAGSLVTTRQANPFAQLLPSLHWEPSGPPVVPPLSLPLPHATGDSAKPTMPNHTSPRRIAVIVRQTVGRAKRCVYPGRHTC